MILPIEANLHKIPVKTLREALVLIDNFASMSEEDQEMYESELRWIQNRNSELDTALDKCREEGIAVGREEGLAKGIGQGIEQGKLEAARKMKVANIKDEVISQCTGLTLEQISEL